MSIKLKHVQEVIMIFKKTKKRETFTSQDFIGAYRKKFESDYINMLAEYKNKQTPKETSKNFGKLHSQIGIFLKRKEKELGIISDGKVTDMNVHHLKTKCTKWNFAL